MILEVRGFICSCTKSAYNFDAHEYYPKQREDSIVWRLVFSKLIMYICKKYMPRCAAVVTVGENIMNEYKNIPDAFCCGKKYP